MNERSELISRLKDSFDARTSYIKSKLAVLVPSQIRALRLQSDMPRQIDLAQAAKLHQSRISMFETPGMANVTLETLAKLAAAFKVGVEVKFVPFSEMLRWENNYSQSKFRVTTLDEDVAFLQPEPSSRGLNVGRSAVTRSNVAATAAATDKPKAASIKKPVAAFEAAASQMMEEYNNVAAGR